jgi:16S rRNA processing protein RimM
MADGKVEYDYEEIIGLAVETTEGRLLGQISRVIATGANDVYFVQDESGAEILLPAIHQVIKTIDLKAGKMIIDPLPGLLEL